MEQRVKILKKKKIRSDYSLRRNNKQQSSQILQFSLMNNLLSFRRLKTSSSLIYLSGWKSVTFFVGTALERWNIDFENKIHLFLFVGPL